MLDRPSRLGWILTTIGLMWATAGRVPAAPSTYAMESAASGSLRGVSFSDSGMILAATADTTDALFFAPATDALENAPTTAIVARIGTGRITENGLTGVDPGFPGVTFADWTPGDPPVDRGLIEIQQPDFQTYFLTTSHGPVSGTVSLVPGVDFPTTAVAFPMENDQGDVSFRVVVASEGPGPSTPVLAEVDDVAGLRPALDRRGRPAEWPSGTKKPSRIPTKSPGR